MSKEDNMAMTHKERLTRVRSNDSDKPQLKSGIIHDDTQWLYRVRLTATFDLPEFTPTHNAYWAFHDSYDGPSIFDVTDAVRVNDRCYEMTILRSEEEEYFKDRHGSGHERGDDEANMDQLFKELSHMNRPWDQHITWEVLTRSTSNDDKKETLRTETYALGERLGPFIAKYIGTTYDYAQFGAAVLDEVETFLKEAE